MENTCLDQIEKLEIEVDKIIKNGCFTHGLGRVLRLLVKEIQLYKNNELGRKNWELNKNKFENLTKLQIGGGKHTLNKFLNLDIIEPADLICDIREGIPLENDRFTFIFSEHTLEHIDYPRSVKFVIGECYRILKSGGQFVIGVPDGALAMNVYLKKERALFENYIQNWYSKRDCLDHFNTYIDLVNYVFRDQDDSPKYNPHYWAYDFEKLENMLKSSGFKKVKHWEFDNQIANPKRAFGSVYVVAIK